ncbi:MAG TPA: SpvB/TcaC N-terminal domain-containing protein, partial [Polyangium sp.]|nr:SpvB/TcaC N-terminal domain-containing protein [Polyangium sp.]
MLYRILFALLVVFVAAACGDSPRYEKKSDLVSPTVPAKPIVPSDSTVGPLPQASGASPAGEYQINIPLDAPAGRAGMAPRLSLAYSSSAGRDNVGFGWSLQGATSFIRVCAA